MEKIKSVYTEEKSTLKEFSKEYIKLLDKNILDFSDKYVKKNLGFYEAILKKEYSDKIANFKFKKLTSDSITAFKIVAHFTFDEILDNGKKVGMGTGIDLITDKIEY